MSTLFLREIEDSEAEAPAAEAGLIQNQLALVVGINQYPAGFNPLENALLDAQELAITLHNEFGFQLLPGGAPLLDLRASLAVLKDAIQTSLTGAGSNTRWLFFFAGHGKVIDGEVYLIPADAIRNDVQTYLPLTWLLEQCRASQYEEILILLDACYSGWAMVRGESLEDRTPTPDEKRVRQIISSGNPRQPVLDAGSKRHSVFTQALLDALQGWCGIHESDGRVRFNRLLDYLVYEIPGRLRASGFESFHQQPIGGYFAGNSDRREFVFQAAVERLPPDILRDIASQDPDRRASGLRRLSSEISNRAFHLALTAQAVQVAAQHVLSDALAVQAKQDIHSQSLFSRTDYSLEPVPLVRAQAVTTLVELLQVFIKQSRAVRLDDMTGEYLKPGMHLLVRALDDLADVSRQAARGLGKLALPEAAQPILERLPTAGPELFLDFVDAIGNVGNTPVILQTLKECLRQGRLVPFIGPDFPASLTGLPDRKTLIQGLANYDGKDPMESLAETAAATMLGNSRSIITTYLRKTIDDPLLQPGEIHRALARLAAPFWISGAYDNLLGKALNANAIVMGEDTKYWKAGQPTLVRLAGDIPGRRGAVVIESDYQQLRENEGDRRLLLSFLRQELQGKVVLFLGFDPTSADFALLVRYILNGHLPGIDIRAFLAWPGAGPEHTWGEHPIHMLPINPIEFVSGLG